MNGSEALRLANLIANLVPGTKIGEDTAVAWALVLDDVRLDDATAALRTIYREQGNDREFGPRRIEPDDILREVKRMRQARIAAGPEYQPSRHDLTPEETKAELREHWRIVGDGGTPPTAAALPQGVPNRPITRALTRSVNR